MLLKYVHTKFEGCLNSYEIGNLICVIILQQNSCAVINVECNKMLAQKKIYVVIWQD